MRELNIEPVDLGDELGQGIQLRLGLAPIVVRRPVPDERLQPGELDALLLVLDGLAIRPTGRSKALAQIVQLCLRNVDPEWAYLVARARSPDCGRQQADRSCYGGGGKKRAPAC